LFCHSDDPIHGLVIIDFERKAAINQHLRKLSSNNILQINITHSVTSNITNYGKFQGEILTNLGA